MTILYEGRRSFWLGATAELIDDLDRDMAWAENHIQKNAAYKYVMGRFVEADKANSNRQFWTHDSLQMSKTSLDYAPLNLLHNPRRVLGTFIANEMMYPTEAADSGGGNPFIEALGVVWQWYFPEETKLLEKAHAEGGLAFSMECIGDSVTCAGEGSCGNTYPYDGPKSPTYCAHLNNGPATKQINDPHFLGGALLIPPVQPGWAGASVTDISELMRQNAEECEVAYEGASQIMPGQDSSTWEALMAQIVSIAKQREAEAAAVLSTKQRKALPLSQFAIPETRSYPIPDINHARNALARVAQNGTPAEQTRVKAAVYRKFPQLKPAASKAAGQDNTSDPSRVQIRPVTPSALNRYPELNVVGPVGVEAASKKK